MAICYNISMKKILFKFVRIVDLNGKNIEMSPARSEKYRSIKNDAVRTQYLASSAALHGILGDNATSFRYGDNGRPCVDGGFVSCAHTDGAAVCVFSDVPVGCDIEKSGRELTGKMQMRFGDIHEWLALEACVKMTGEGLAGIKIYRRSGDVMLDMDGNIVAHARFLEYDEYSIAVCCSEEFEIKTAE